MRLLAVGIILMALAMFAVAGAIVFAEPQTITVEQSRPPCDEGDFFGDC